MATTLPSGITTSTDGMTTTITLPPFNVGVIHRFGFVPILFGLGILAFMIFWMVGASGIMEGNIVWPRIIFAAFGLPMLGGALMPILLGIRLQWPSPTVISITDLKVTTNAGLISIRRVHSMAVSKITGLRIGQVIRNPEDETQNPFSGLRSLYADGGKKPFTIAMGYSRQTLEPLAAYIADDLARRNFTNVLRPGAPVVAPPPVTVEPEPADDSAGGDVPEAAVQPAGSRIAFLSTPESLTFMVPRTGFRGVAGFLLFFSLFWLGISGTVFCVMLVKLIQHRDFMDVLPLMFILLFVGIGAALFVSSIQLAFRKAVIVATRDMLVYTQTGPIRNRELQWPINLLKAIRSEYSGSKINERRLRELRIFSTDDKHKGMFDGRDDAELAWLAATLRNFYGLRNRSTSEG